MLYFSPCEGLGSAVLMALSAGVPVIASRIGGVPEVIEDGKTGLLAENAAQSFARAIRRMLDDPGLAASCARAGKDLVRQKFSVGGMVRNTARVYGQVLGRGEPGLRQAG